MPDRPGDIPAHHHPSVAILAPSLPLQGAGGVASAHYNLYRSLQHLGCKTSLVTFNEVERGENQPGVYRFGASQRLRSFLSLGVHGYLKAIGSKKTAYHLADIVSSMPGALRADRRLGTLHPDIIVIPDHGAPGLVLRRRGAPVILAVHHVPARFIADPMLGDYCLLDVDRATALEQRVLRNVAAVVCPSEYMKEIFCRTYTFEREVAVIPNLVDQSWLDTILPRDVRREVGLPPDSPVVYIPSAGSHYKGAQYVFEIVRKLAGSCERPLAFYLSGHIDAPLKAELEHAPDNTRFFMPGRVSQEVNLAYVKSCSFGVSPTLIESFGMAILEAGFCGVPIVAFAVGGVGEVVRHGENGFLAPLFDMEGLLAGAKKLLDPRNCERLRQSTALSTRARFDPDQIALRYLSLFERQIKSNQQLAEGSEP